MTNTQMDLLAEEIYSNIYKVRKSELDARQITDEPAFVAELRQNEDYRKAVECERALEAAMPFAENLEIAIEQLGLNKYYGFYGKSLTSGKEYERASAKWIKDMICKEFQVDMPVTKNKLKTDIMISVLGAGDINELIYSLTAKYLGDASNTQ